MAKTKGGEPCKIPTRDGHKYCHVHRKRKRWRWTLLISLFGFVLTILGHIANVTGILDYVGINPYYSEPQPPVVVIESDDMESFRQTRFIRLVWRIYFKSEQDNNLVSRNGGIHLVAFIPHDKLYHETYWDERMHVIIRSDTNSDFPSVELARNHIASPFQRYDPQVPSLVQSPALGQFLASYWELEDRTTGADLENMWFQIYFLHSYLAPAVTEIPDEWPNAVSKVVVLADDIPLAIFDYGEIPTAKPMDISLIKYTVDPYTGELLEK